MSSFRAAAPANELRLPRPGDSPGQSDGAGRGGAGPAGVARPHVRRGCCDSSWEALGAGSGYLGSAGPRKVASRELQPRR